MRYEINGGRIVTWSLEVHLTDHCNLRCRNCCTLSPQLAPRLVSPAALAADLALAAAVLRPNLLKLTGGEPLLHPALAECLEVARASGLAEQVSLTSNGLLLASAPDALFERLDRLTVSHYLSAPVPAAVLSRVAARCREHGVVLTVKQVDRFQRLDLAEAQDETAAAAVFEACWLRNRCHLLHEGRLYTCTRPPHLDAVHGGGLAERDGVVLAGEDRLARVLAYLESEQPLQSCRHCLGASGGWEVHTQIPEVRATA